MKRFLFLLPFFAGLAFAQTPDCLPPAFVVNAANYQLSGEADMPLPAGYFDNRAIGCQTWVVSYQSDGNLSGFTLAFQSSTGNGTNSPVGTFTSYTGSMVASSASFGTANSGIATFTSLSSTPGSSVNTPWVQVDLSGGTGVTFQFRIQLYGYRTGPNAATGSGASTGCPNPCPVTQDTTPWVVQQAGLGTFNSNQQAVTGSAVALPTNTSKNVCVHALIGNTINVYAGPAGVTTATGMEIPPGQNFCWELNNTNLIYVIASTTGAGVSWTLTN